MPEKKDITKPLPLWAKALIAFVGLGMVSIFALIILLTALAKNQIENSQDPKFIATVAAKVVRLPEPLPRGYKYAGGFDFGFLQAIAIDYENGKQSLLFIARPTDMDSRELLNDSYEKGFITSEAFQPTEFASIVEEGGWLIQDTQIPYRLGKLQNSQGLALVACVSTVEKGRAEGSPVGGGGKPRAAELPEAGAQAGRGMVLYALQPKGETFDMKVCTNLLQGD